MSRIVIMPSFAESHLIKCQIPNIVATINPDVVIYNEGLFPRGPENKTVVVLGSTASVGQGYFDKAEFCYSGSNSGWDLDETKKLIEDAKVQYPHIQWILNEVAYPANWSADQCYTYAVSNFKDCGITVSAGDYIFPIEPDVFHLESDAEFITMILDGCRPNTGVRTNWVDFLETQSYTEALHHPNGGRMKSRKFVICFGDMNYYQSIVSNFMSQKYDDLQYIPLTTYHYCWFRFGRWREARYKLIQRDDPAYWEAFDIGLQTIRQNTIDGRFDPVVIRPSRNDVGRMAMPIMLPHPEAIKTHPNYVTNIQS